MFISPNISTIIGEIRLLRGETLPTVLPLLIAIAIVLVASKLAGAFLNRLGQPAVLGQLVVGLLIGPSLFAVFNLPYFEQAHIGETMHELGEIGVIFLMFSAGLEIHLSDFAKNRKPATLSGVLGVMFPLALGTLATLPFGYDLAQSLFVGIVLAATSVSISAQTLMELGRLRSREGLTLLGAAVVDDVLAIAVLSGFVAFAAGGGSSNALGVAIIIGRMLLFLVAAFFIAQWLLPPLVAWANRLPVSESTMGIVIALVFLFAWSSEAVGGVAAITGAFVAGLGLNRSPLRKQVIERMHTLSYAFFIPIFLVNIGLSANLRTLSVGDIGFASVICVVAVLTKVLGSGLGAKLGGMTWMESLRVGLGMVSRGEVGLIVAGVGVSAGFVSDNIFTVSVVMVLVTTLLAPPLLRIAFSERSQTNAAVGDSGD